MGVVVVIDDMVVNRNIMSRLVMSVEEGLRVSAFADPVTALEKMRSGLVPDLIITDYNMPSMNGVALVNEIRATPELAEVPTIVVTVYDGRDVCYQALEAGATDFLLSPFDPIEFRARARNLLTLRRQQLRLRQHAADLERALQSRPDAAGSGLGGLRGALELLPIPLKLADAEGAESFANSAYLRLFASRSHADGDADGEKSIREEHALRELVLDQKAREAGRTFSSMMPLAAGAGATRRNVVVSKVPIVDLSGQISNIVTAALEVGDVEEFHARRDELDRDEVTGLPTAAVFRDRLEMAISRSSRENDKLAFLHLGLDRFRTINNVFGEASGDRLLHEVGQRLQSRVRPDECIARLRSDEFAILQTETKRLDDAAALAHRLTEAFAAPFVIDGEEIHMSASIGITVFPEDGGDADALLRNAQLALLRAKTSGRDAYRFFAREMDAAARRTLVLERELRQALAASQFVVHYQPQVEITSGRIVGMEALVRWNHPHRGLVGPGEFIQLADEIGLMAPLTSWILRNACEQHRRWRDIGLEQLRLSINLSPTQFRDGGVENMIERILRDTGLPPHALDVELTESAVIENSTAAVASLHNLHRLGVSLSIDDFGTGYSSLAYVKRLPVQRLKIDRSFVSGLERSANDEVIVRAIVNLAHSLGLTVVAEGVESEAQLRFLDGLRCDEAQGFLIGRPVDAEAFSAKFHRPPLRRTAVG